MAADQQDGKETQLQNFHGYFTAQMRVLNRELDSAITTAIAAAIDRQELDRLTKATERVQQEVQDARDSTPDHDMAKYATSLKTFKDRLQTARNLNAPKAKFSFKSARKLAAPSPTIDAEKLASTASPELEERDAAASETEGDKLFDDLSYKHLITDPSVAGVLSHIIHSVINLRHPTMSHLARHATLALRKIRGSLLVLGRVDGALHVTDMRNSVLVVETNQLRLHECRDLTVYLSCASRPIIEHCTAIRFAPLPATYVNATASLSADQLPEPIKQNRWNQVDDFNWLKQSPSPNFALLDEAGRIRESVWKDVVPGSERIGLTDILKAVGIKDAEKGRSRRGSETAGGDGF